MYWTYAGYLVVYYVAFAIVFAVMLPTHSHPWLGAFAAFVVWPAMVAACSVEMFVGQSQVKNAIRKAMYNGRLSRRYAAGIGVVAGISSLAANAAFWYLSNSMFSSLLAALLLVGLTTMFAPLLCVGWLARAVKRSDSTGEA